jgi:hypothetical protein
VVENRHCFIAWLCFTAWLLTVTPPKQQGQKQSHLPIVFDCSFPRTLFEETSPLPLSSMKELVHEILDGMHEQRMSVCQSLCQYIFMHSADKSAFKQKKMGQMGKNMAMKNGMHPVGLVQVTMW